MRRSDAELILNEAESDNRAVLYHARHNDETASQVVPKLIALLDSEDRDILFRTLKAFVTIASAAHAAAERIRPHLQSDDPAVAQVAIWALARVSLHDPDLAIDPLVCAAASPDLRKAAMQALLGFGGAARRAAPLFVAAFEDSSADMRCLALRGLSEIDADPHTVSPVLTRAATDKSKRVREYAARKFSHGSNGPGRP
jgi:hypothetical protein